VRTISGGLALVACAILTAGCTTHEAKFERDVPLPPSKITSDSISSADAASRLIQRYQARVISLPTESLAPLAQAAALLFEATGAPGMKAAAGEFGDTLLEARVPVASGQAFFSSASRGRPDLETTADAGNALIDVFRVTDDERYLAAAQSAARAAASTRMGWIATRRGFAVRAPGQRRLYNVPLTADVALLLKRAATTDARRVLAKQADSAFHFLAVHQAAVGRWQLNVGAKTPLTLKTWARTLLALASTRSVENQGIVGGGAAGLWTAAFTPSGAPRGGSLSDQRGIGVALSLRLFQRFAGTSRDADLTYERILNARRPDGTVVGARRDDIVAQGSYTLAFAERALALRHPNQWYRRLS
jgi:hypothetical protein